MLSEWWPSPQKHPQCHGSPAPWEHSSPSGAAQCAWRSPQAQQLSWTACKGRARPHIRKRMCPTPLSSTPAQLVLHQSYPRAEHRAPTCACVDKMPSSCSQHTNAALPAQLPADGTRNHSSCPILTSGKWNQHLILPQMRWIRIDLVFAQFSILIPSYFPLIHYSFPGIHFYCHPVLWLAAPLFIVISYLAPSERPSLAIFFIIGLCLNLLRTLYIFSLALSITFNHFDYLFFYVYFLH